MSKARCWARPIRSAAGGFGLPPRPAAGRPRAHIPPPPAPPAPPPAGAPPPPSPPPAAVTHVVIQPLDADAFALRAESRLHRPYERNINDLNTALVLNPNLADAPW